MVAKRKFNDFVLKFANVNGSGSASANLMCAKALFRMGIPVSAKNIFPSNIQGLPTWYEIRASEAGYVARRDGIDIMVAMNPQSYAQDARDVLPGGTLIYDSSRERDFGREDIAVIGNVVDNENPRCQVFFSLGRGDIRFADRVSCGSVHFLIRPHTVLCQQY